MKNFLKSVFSGVLNLFTGGIGGGIVDIVQTFLGNKRREQKLDAELESQEIAAEAKRRRALIRASRGPLRFIALIAGLGPFFAPLLPGISIADTTTYVDQVIDGMPDWYVNIVLMMYGFIWGGSEWKGLIAERDEERANEKELDRKKEEKMRSPGPGPPGGGP